MKMPSYSLGSPGKDRQRFVEAFVLFTASHWSNRLSNFENVVKALFISGCRTSNDVRFCQTG